MVRVLLVRPGATEFDLEGRMKGSLDIPLSTEGARQVSQVAADLLGEPITAIYASPARCCQQTAEALAENRDVRVKYLVTLQNVDHGLWHGKLIDEVRQTQPRVYREGQENPESVCPPAGEPFPAARKRVAAALVKVLKKHKDGVIAVVVPEPLASVCRTVLDASDLGDLWKAECDCGRWEVYDVESSRLSG